MKYQEYKNKIITEIFDKPVKWKLDGYPIEIDDGEIIKTYSFEIPPYMYYVELTQIDDTKLTIVFEIVLPNGETTYNITKTGNEIRVFATVLDIIKNFIKEYSDVKEIGFTAEKHGSDNSRVSLYKRFIKKYMPRNWKVKVYDELDEVGFHLIKK